MKRLIDWTLAPLRRGFFVAAVAPRVAGITIIHDDCARALEAMPSRSVDLICTDPPYVTRAIGAGMARGRKYFRDITAQGLDEGFDLALLDEFLRVLRVPNIIVFASRAQLRPYLNWAYERNLKWALITWHKTNPTPLVNNTYLPDTEYIFHFWADRKLTGRYHTKRRFYVQQIEKNDFDHPTVKPLNIICNLIENASAVGDLVLDPFLGSGTTAVAAKILNRRCIGIERRIEYFRLAHRRVASTK